MCKKCPLNNLPSLHERRICDTCKAFAFTEVRTMTKENSTLLPRSKTEQDAVETWRWNWLVYADMLKRSNRIPFWGEYETQKMYR